jgi:hypothetical protein
MAAVKLFTPEQLKVFATLPTDSINTNIHETFVATAPAPVLPRNQEEWATQRDAWLAALKTKCFAAWPPQACPLRLERKFSATRNGLTLQAFDFDSEPHVRLRLYLLARSATPQEISLNLRDETGWLNELGWLRMAFEKELFDEPPSDPAKKDGIFQVQFETFSKVLKDSASAMAFFAPRGVGLNAWSGDARRQVQIRRRFMLLGETVDSARVWDIRRACQALRLLPETAKAGLALNAGGRMAVNVVYASIFEPSIDGLQLTDPVASHRAGPDFLNVLRVLDVPQAAAMAADRSKVAIYAHVETNGWEFPTGVAANLGWGKERFGVWFRFPPNSLLLPRSQ